MESITGVRTPSTWAILSKDTGSPPAKRMASVFPISSSWFSVVSPPSTNVTSKSSPSPSMRRRRFFTSSSTAKKAATRWERSRFPANSAR